MDPLTSAVLTSLATGYFVNFTTPAVENFFEKAFALKPSLERDLQQATTPDDFEKVFEEATGIVDAAAGEGKIEVNLALLDAMRGIRFDHQNGTVSIQGVTLQAPHLQTGGVGEGKTDIGSRSTLRSEGTVIQVGEGASIKITGNAHIRQN